MFNIHKHKNKFTLCFFSIPEMSESKFAKDNTNHNKLNFSTWQTPCLLSLLPGSHFFLLSCAFY